MTPEQRKEAGRCLVDLRRQLTEIATRPDRYENVKVEIYLEDNFHIKRYLQQFVMAFRYRWRKMDKYGIFAFLPSEVIEKLMIENLSQNGQVSDMGQTNEAEENKPSAKLPEVNQDPQNCGSATAQDAPSGAEENKPSPKLGEVPAKLPVETVQDATNEAEENSAILQSFSQEGRQNYLPSTVQTIEVAT